MSKFRAMLAKRVRQGRLPPWQESVLVELAMQMGQDPSRLRGKAARRSFDANCAKLRKKGLIDHEGHLTSDGKATLARIP